MLEFFYPHIAPRLLDHEIWQYLKIYRGILALLSELHDKTPVGLGWGNPRSDRFSITKGMGKHQPGLEAAIVIS